MKKLILFICTVLSISSFGQSVSPDKLYYLKFLNIYGQMQTIYLKGSVIGEITAAQIASFKTEQFGTASYYSNTVYLKDKLIQKDKALSIISISIQKQKDRQDGQLSTTMKNVFVFEQNNTLTMCIVYWSKILNGWSINELPVNDTETFLAKVKLFQ